MTRRGPGEGSIYPRGDGRWEGAVHVGYEGNRRVRKFAIGHSRKEVSDKLDVLMRAHKERAPAEGPAFTGHFGEATYDPFERVGSGLLLAEEFARLELRPFHVVLDWFARHGVLDIVHFLPLDPLIAAWAMAPTSFHDLVRDVEAQQRNVRWHLLSLARLSDQLAAHGGSWDTISDEGWDPRWVQPAISAGLDMLWLGGAEPRDRHIGLHMRDRADPDPRFVTPPEMTDEFYRDWCRRAYRSYQRIVAEEVPIVWVPRPDMYFPTWEAQANLESPLEHALTDGVGTDPWSLVELQRRLMEPFITGAGEHAVAVGWPDADHRGRPLVVREQRTWDSLLAPVYVQLLEGLRRVSEGHRGGAFCKECGQPFLTLDGRRSSFCTDRERYRYGQREYRKRHLVIDTEDADPRVEAMVEEHLREHPAAAEEPDR